MNKNINLTTNYMNNLNKNNTHKNYNTKIWEIKYLLYIHQVTLKYLIINYHTTNNNNYN